MTEFERRYAAVRAFLEAAALGDREAYRDSLHALDWPAAWIEAFRAVVSLGHVHPDAQRMFATQWVGLSDTIPAGTPNGKRLRKIFEGEINLLVDGLRLLLPPLKAQPSTIYRGQASGAFDSGDLGLSWTTMPLIAEFYAREMAPGSEPGMILSASCPAEAIIGATGTHEIVVDPRRLENVQVICRPKAKFAPWQAGEGYIGQCELLDVERQRQTMAVKAFVEAAIQGSRSAYIASLDALNWPTAWIEIFRAVVDRGQVHPDTRLTFRDQWRGLMGEFITYPPAGKRIRAIFADHPELLINGLRLLLPPMEGEAPPAIYRGQSLEEYQAGRVGLSWSVSPTLAEGYARDHRLNAGEAVVLAELSPANAIVGVIDHAEVVVDHRMIKNPIVIFRGSSKFKADEDQSRRSSYKTWMYAHLIPWRGEEAWRERYWAL